MRQYNDNCGDDEVINNGKLIREENMEVRFIFVNHPVIKKQVKATDPFAAASKAMELTCEQWPVMRPINVQVWKYNSQAGSDESLIDLFCYRVTKDWFLIEEDNPYTALIPKEKR